MAGLLVPVREASFESVIILYVAEVLILRPDNVIKEGLYVKQDSVLATTYQFQMLSLRLRAISKHVNDVGFLEVLSRCLGRGIAVKQTASQVTV